MMRFLFIVLLAIVGTQAQSDPERNPESVMDGKSLLEKSFLDLDEDHDGELYYDEFTAYWIGGFSRNNFAHNVAETLYGGLDEGPKFFDQIQLCDSRGTRGRNVAICVSELFECINKNDGGLDQEEFITGFTHAICTQLSEYVELLSEYVEEAGLHPYRWAKFECSDNSTSPVDIN